MPSDRLEDECSIALTSSVSKIDFKNRVFVSAEIFCLNQIKLNSQTQKAHRKIFDEAPAD